MSALPTGLLCPLTVCCLPLLFCHSHSCRQTSCAVRYRLRQIVFVPRSWLTLTSSLSATWLWSWSQSGRDMSSFYLSFLPWLLSGSYRLPLGLPHAWRRNCLARVFSLDVSSALGYKSSLYICMQVPLFMLLTSASSHCQLSLLSVGGRGCSLFLCLRSSLRSELWTRLRGWACSGLLSFSSYRPLVVASVQDILLLLFQGWEVLSVPSTWIATDFLHIVVNIFWKLQGRHLSKIGKKFMNVINSKLALKSFFWLLIFRIWGLKSETIFSTVFPVGILFVTILKFKNIMLNITKH